MTKRFFVSTPIYYPNAVPHIGHAYSSFIADILARYKRLLGYEVKFSTGVDENSQKIIQKAQEAQMPLYEFLDMYAEKHQHVRDSLRISYTDFIRTTSAEHKTLVQRVLAMTHTKGDIYQGVYEGYYCIGCEAFKKQNDIIKADGSYADVPAGSSVCPLHPNKPLSRLSEQNYFFSLSSYQDTLHNFFATHPDFITPRSRATEITSMIAEGLDDFSISRETNSFGIPLPFDDDHVTYVWYDALFNYVTVCQQDYYWDEDTEIVHVLGKDIARFHAIYRLAMLLSIGYRLPDKEVITGFFTVDGQKMSKSLNNVIDPVDVVQSYNRDALVFYLMYDIVIGNDGDFSRDRFSNVYNTMLLGGWGNFVSRVVSLASKAELDSFHGGSAPYTTDFINYVQELQEQDNGLIPLFAGASFSEIIDPYISGAHLQKLIRERYQLVQGANKFIDAHQPRTLRKTNPAQATAVLSYCLYLIKQLTLISSSFLIEGHEKIQQILQTPIWTSLPIDELRSTSTGGVTIIPGHIYEKKQS